MFQFVGTTASDAWLFLLLYVLAAILAAAAVLSLIYLANHIICGCCPVRSRSLGHIDARSEFYTDWDWEAAETSTLAADHPLNFIYIGGVEQQRLDVNDPPPTYQRQDEPIYEEIQSYAEVGEEHIYVNIIQNGETGEAADAENIEIAADHAVHAEVGELVAGEHVNIQNGVTGEAADAEEAWLFIDNEDGYIEIRNDILLDGPVAAGVGVVSQQERERPPGADLPFDHHGASATNINRQKRKPVVTNSGARVRDTRESVTSSGARARDPPHRPKRTDSPYPGHRSRPLARVRANMVSREDCLRPPPFPLHLMPAEPGYSIIVTTKETNV